MAKIKQVGRKQPRIRDIGPKQPRIDPEEVAAALGAEKARAPIPLGAHPTQRKKSQP